MLLKEFNQNQARDNRGRWIKIGQIQEAAINPTKATELRAIVAPEDKSKLEAELKKADEDYYDSIHFSEIGPKTLRTWKSVFPGRDPREAAKMVGAQPDSLVRVRINDDGNIEITSRNEAYAMKRTVTQIQGGGYAMQNDEIYIKEEFRGDGLGTKIFADQVANLRAMGFSHISCWAGRNEVHNGYYTWARLGYDCPLHSILDLNHDLTKVFPSASTLQDIMTTKEGREWWKEKGKAFKAVFNLSPDSRNSRVLADYLTTKENPQAQKKSYSAQTKSVHLMQPSDRAMLMEACRGLMGLTLEKAHAPRGFNRQRPLVISGKPYIGGQYIPGVSQAKVDREAAKQNSKVQAGAPAKKQSDTQRLMAGLAAGGFSWNPTSKKVPTDGYMVSIYPESGAVFNSLDDVKLGTLFDYIDERSKEWKANENVHIGGWLDDSDGKVYLDLSLRVDDEKTAHELSTKYGQLAFYDVKNGKVITTMTQEQQLQWEKENNVGAKRQASNGAGTEQSVVDGRQDPNGAGNVQGTAGAGAIGAGGSGPAGARQGTGSTEGKYSHDGLKSVIDDWMTSAGIDPAKKFTRDKGYRELPSQQVLDSVAAEQQAATSTPDEQTSKAYDAFKSVLLQQYEAIKKSGLKIKAWRGEGEPYKSSPDKIWSPSSDVMRQRVQDEGEFYFFMTEKGFGSEGASEEQTKHPLLQMSPAKTDDGEPMLYNDLFRVVHDAVAHLYGGYSFSTKGEFNGMLAHASTLPREAWPALFSETFGQNSVYEKTGKFANQNVYTSKYLNLIDEGLSQMTKSYKQAQQADIDSDEPVGAGRLRQHPDAATRLAARELLNKSLAPKHEPDLLKACRGLLKSSLSDAEGDGILDIDMDDDDYCEDAIDIMDYGDADIDSMVSDLKVFLDDDGLVNCAIQGNKLICSWGDWASGESMDLVKEICEAHGFEYCGMDEAGDLEQIYPGCELLKSMRLKLLKARAPAGFTQQHPLVIDGNNFIGGMWIPNISQERVDQAARDQESTRQAGVEQQRQSAAEPTAGDQPAPAGSPKQQGESSIAADETKKRDGALSKPRIRAVLEAASKIEFTDDYIGGEGKEFDADEVEESLDSDARNELQEHLNEEEMNQLDNYIDIDYDWTEIARNAGYDNTDIIDKAREIVDGDDEANASLDEWAESDDSAASGTDHVEMLRDFMKERHPDYDDQFADMYRDAENAMIEAQQEYEDEYRQSILESGEIDVSEYREQWLRDYFDNNGLAGSEDAQTGVWGKDNDGAPTYYFDTENGKYQIWTSEGSKSTTIGFCDAEGSHDITGAGNAHKVFMQVLPAISALINNGKQDCYQFSAAGESRQKLYDRLASSIADVQPEYSVMAYLPSPTSSKQYVVCKRELKDSYIEMASRQVPDIRAKLQELVKSEAAANRDWLSFFEPGKAKLDQWREESAWSYFDTVKEKKPFNGITEETRAKLRNKKSKMAKQKMAAKRSGQTF